jgi:hypothetical protein
MIESIPVFSYILKWLNARNAGVRAFIPAQLLTGGKKSSAGLQLFVVPEVL